MARACAERCRLLEDQRHYLVREHVHRVSSGLDVFDPAGLGEAKQRHGLEQRLELRQKNVQFARVLARRPVRPRLQERRDRRAGASTWMTWSRSPTSIPSSIVDVQTTAVFWPRANCSSASVRSARLTELW